MSKDAVRTIGRSVMARVPVIGIESPEETRIIDTLLELANNARYPDKPTKKTHREPRPLLVWSCTSGIIQMNSKCKTEKDEPGLVDPVAALQFFINWGANKEASPAIFVMLDPMPYFRMPAFVRLIRDATTVLRGRRQSLILVAPFMTLPAELMYDIVILDYPLPTLSELTEFVKVELGAMQDNGYTVDVNGDVESIARALAGLTWEKCVEAMKVALVTTGEFNSDTAIPLLLKQKALLISASPALEYISQKEAWENVGGLDLLKPYMRATMRATEQAAREFGVDPPKGVLLAGVQGCGKSLCAKVAAGNRLPLIRFDISAIYGGLVGESETNMRQALRIIDAVDNVVVWIDEIDKTMGGDGDHDSGTSQRVLATFLTWMQEKTSNAYVVATANNIERLTPPLMRRFDSTWYVGMPGEQARKEIFSIHLAKRNRNPGDFDLDTLVHLTDNFTGSEIEDIVREAIAAAYAAHNGEKDITTQALDDQIQQTTPLFEIQREQIREMEQWASRARAASSQQESGKKPLGNYDF